MSVNVKRVSGQRMCEKTGWWVSDGVTEWWKREGKKRHDWNCTFLYSTFPDFATNLFQKKSLLEMSVRRAWSASQPSAHLFFIDCWSLEMDRYSMESASRTKIHGIWVLGGWGSASLNDAFGSSMRILNVQCQVHLSKRKLGSAIIFWVKTKKRHQQMTKRRKQSAPKIDDFVRFLKQVFGSFLVDRVCLEVRDRRMSVRSK